MRRVWLAVCVVGLGAGMVCAQTPSSQANTPQWKQTPEGTPAVPPTNMNCSGSATRGDDGKVTTSSNCPAAQDQPVPSNAAQQFPYPGDSQTPQQTNSGQQAAPAPNAPGAQQAPANPSQQFPYPGDDSSSSSSSSSSGDVKPAPPGGLNDAGSSGSSSSSSSGSGYSSSNADQPSPDEDDEGVAKKTRASRTRPTMPAKTPDQRFAEDMEVAGFYQNNGNFMGAYMRAKDAVSISTDNPDAHLALAEAARKLGKLDEAEMNYKKCLQLDPVPKTKKAAESALKEMTGGS